MIFKTTVYYLTPWVEIGIMQFWILYDICLLTGYKHLTSEMCDFGTILVITWDYDVALVSNCTGRSADMLLKEQHQCNHSPVWQDMLVQFTEESKFIIKAPSNILISSNYLLQYANKKKAISVFTRIGSHSTTFEHKWICVERLSGSCCAVFANCCTKCWFGYCWTLVGRSWQVGIPKQALYIAFTICLMVMCT